MVPDFLRFFASFRSNRRASTPAAAYAKEVNQSTRDCTIEIQSNYCKSMVEAAHENGTKTPTTFVTV
jgi:hypothetical protein